MSSAAVDVPTAPPFRPNSPEYLSDPYAHLRELREQTPICSDRASGLWFLLRFDDVGEGLTHTTRGDNVDELRGWTWKSLELINAFLTPEQLRDNQEASGYLAEHLRDVIEWKRDHLDDDVLSQVIAAADDGKVMRPEQVVSYVHTLYL